MKLKLIQQKVSTIEPCPEKEKKSRRKSAFTGFDLGTSRFQEQNTTDELQSLVALNALKKLRNSYTYDIVLANFSQLVPNCAN